MTSIFLAEHHHLCREGIARLIKSIDGFNIAGQASTAEAAVNFVSRDTPDILLLEMSMPNMSGFEVLRRIQRSHIGTRVVLLPIGQASQCRYRRCGRVSTGTLVKKLAPQSLSERFGRKYVSENISRDLARYAYGDLSDNPLQQLSVREIQVMLMALKCKSPTVIAEAPHLSAKTVNSYRYWVFEKLAVSSDVELTMPAVQHDAIELGRQHSDGSEEITVKLSRKGPLGTAVLDANVEVIADVDPQKR